MNRLALLIAFLSVSAAAYVAYGLCTKGGKPDGDVLCLYIPTWGS